VASNSAGKPIEILQWLRELGLEQYADAFRDNAIDAKILPTLTANDLRDIGVTLVGHRRGLLNAIAELSRGRSPTGPAPAAPEGQAPERRQLSVMFCDLVGSTALSTKLDPEDLRTLVGAYHRAVNQAVAVYDGFVAKYMGDGVLVYFGYPRAHEDDAERAIRAGLQAIDAVGRLDAKSDKLQVRIGIATGFAVVGDLIGEGSAREQTVVGETPNLAARLQALAAPGRLVIAAGTSLIWRISVRNSSPDLPIRSQPGWFCAKARRSVGSRRFTLRRHHLSAVTKRSKFSCAAGRTQSVAKGGWC
jgi:class 3 adenylate cyclase